MAYTNTNFLEKVSVPIPFSRLIGLPLKACIDAQDTAARSTIRFIESVGLQPSDDPNAVPEIVTVSFSFRMDGRWTQLQIPLLAIVPVPYLSIDTVDIHFRADIRYAEHTLSQEEARNIQLVATYARETKGEANATYDQSVDVRIRASQDHVPAGLAKVMGFLEQSVTPESELVEITDPALARLFRTEKTRTISSGQASSEQGLSRINVQGLGILDKELVFEDIDISVLTESELEEGLISRTSIERIRTMNFDYRLYPFASVDDLRHFHVLYAFGCYGIDLTAIKRFNLAYLSHIKYLYLGGNGIDIRANQWRASLDFAWLSDLRVLYLSKWRQDTLSYINLTGSGDLLTLIVRDSHIRRIDISLCRDLQTIDFKSSTIEELVVWEGFEIPKNETEFPIKSGRRIFDRRLRAISDKQIKRTKYYNIPKSTKLIYR